MFLQIYEKNFGLIVSKWLFGVSYNLAIAGYSQSPTAGSLNFEIIGGIIGQMIYTFSDNLWAFSPSEPFNWDAGLNTLSTQFIDNDGNTLDIDVQFNFTTTSIFRNRRTVISVYPNPTKGLFQFTVLEDNIQTITVSTLTGKIIFNQDVSRQKGIQLIYQISIMDSILFIHRLLMESILAQK